jgi:hypothetical protein
MDQTPRVPLGAYLAELLPYTICKRFRIFWIRPWCSCVDKPRSGQSTAARRNRKFLVGYLASWNLLRYSSRSIERCAEDHNPWKGTGGQVVARFVDGNVEGLDWIFGTEEQACSL